MDDAGLPAVIDAIRHLEGCAATWVESVPVRDTHERQTVWEGDVQVFDLVDHPRASSAPTPGATRPRARDVSSTSCSTFHPWTGRSWRSRRLSTLSTSVSRRRTRATRFPLQNVIECLPKLLRVDRQLVAVGAEQTAHVRRLFVVVVNS
jgi:hypothetical protein